MSVMKLSATDFEVLKGYKSVKLDFEGAHWVATATRDEGKYVSVVGASPFTAIAFLIVTISSLVGES